MIHAVTDLRTGEKTTYTIAITGRRDGRFVSSRDAAEFVRFVYLRGRVNGLEEALQLLQGEPR